MIHELVAQLDNGISALQTLLYVDVVQPIFYRFNLMGYDDDTYDALYWVIVGALQILVSYALLRPLEALRPVETWKDRKALRVDVLYTWIAKLGIIDLSTHRLIDTIAVGRSPHGLFFANRAPVYAPNPD